MVLLPLLLVFRRGLFGDRSNNIVGTHEGKQFFILGSGRNGSTLLALILNRHPNLFLPPEQFALPYSIMDWQLTIKTNWEDYCQKVLSNYRNLNQDWLLDDTDFESINQELRNIPEKHQRPASVYAEVMKTYALKTSSKADFLGDHSPVTTLFYNLVFSEFPKAKYIFLVRNPLDVVLSYSKMSNNPASDYSYAVWKWNRSVEAFESLEQSGAAIRLVKYEDLVTEPKKTVVSIQKFLGIDELPLLDSSAGEKDNDSLSAKDYEHHQNLFKPISADSVGRWKTELNEATVRRVIPLVASNAAKFGYSFHDF